MGTIGKSGNPLAVSLGFLLPVKKNHRLKKQMCCYTTARAGQKHFLFVGDKITTMF